MNESVSTEQLVKKVLSETSQEISAKAAEERACRGDVIRPIDFEIKCKKCNDTHIHRVWFCDSCAKVHGAAQKQEQDFSDLLEMQDRWPRIASHAYREYKKGCPDVPEWEDLTKEHRAGFTAAIYHSLVTLGVLDQTFNVDVEKITNNPYILKL